MKESACRKRVSGQIRGMILLLEAARGGGSKWVRAWEWKIRDPCDR